MVRRLNGVKEKVEIKKAEEVKEEWEKQKKLISSLGSKTQQAMYVTLATTDRVIGGFTSLYKKIFVMDEAKKTNFYKEQGLNFFDKGDYRKAAEFFLTYIENGGAKDSDALFNLGLAYSKIDKDKDALKYFKKAEEFENNDPDIIYEIGACLARTEQYPQAIACLKKAIKVAPECADIYYLLGSSYEKSDQPQEAMGMYKKAIELEPKNPVFYQALGFAYEYSGRHKDAIICFKRAMELEKHR